MIVIDDPQKIEQADSPLVQQAVIDWFDQTSRTAAERSRAGAIIVIGQRLHEDDLFGHLLDQGGWTHLCLPASYDPTIPTSAPRTRVACRGSRFGRVGGRRGDRAGRSADLGSYGSASMLQQLPAPTTGGIFQREWWRYYDPAKPLPRFRARVPIVGSRVHRHARRRLRRRPGLGHPRRRRYLLHQFRARIDFTHTIQAIRDQTQWVSSTCPGFSSHTEPD